MSGPFDVIVVGSGFGGAVVACRLAEAGARVLVLERGRRWTREHYPRQPGDPWLYSHTRPDKHNGWLDLRFFRGMAVAQGAGVGGGSLCYSSVVMEAGPECWEQGWPPELTTAELAPYYSKVHAMLDVRPIPSGQHTQRYKLAQAAAAKLGHLDRFQSVPLAVAFDPDWNYDLPEPHDLRHARAFTNAHGQGQATCIHLGNCDIGCDVRAKNTLDLNYIPRAERAGAEVRPLHVVRLIERAAEGYRVIFDRIEGSRLIPGEERARKVVLAAGSLGSTELLLRCRDHYRTLPALSRRLGERWSANANVLTPDIYRDAAKVQQSVGPTISAGLDFMDGSVAGERFFVEDDGFPNVLRNAVSAKMRSAWWSPLAWALRFSLRAGPDALNPLANVMVWLGEGVDAANGRLWLGRSWLPPWRRQLKLAWDVRQSEKTILTILEMHRRLSDANGGQICVPWYWRWFRALMTVHPLGGCGMGTGPEDGVIAHNGQVFGHPNLYVADGAVLPRAIGRNPSMTIAALAERVADIMVHRSGKYAWDGT
jgi:cholesterol oxidase